MTNTLAYFVLPSGSKNVFKNFDTSLKCVGSFSAACVDVVIGSDDTSSTDGNVVTCVTSSSTSDTASIVVGSSKMAVVTTGSVVGVVDDTT